MVQCLHGKGHRCQECLAQQLRELERLGMCVRLSSGDGSNGRATLEGTDTPVADRLEACVLSRAGSEASSAGGSDADGAFAPRHARDHGHVRSFWASMVPENTSRGRYHAC